MKLRPPHNAVSDCWIIINAAIYDVTRFLVNHPGGAERIISHFGQDATQAFSTQDGEGQHSASAQAQLRSLRIGSITPD